jgi:hypothetical protein
MREPLLSSDLFKQSGLSAMIAGLNLATIFQFGSRSQTCIVSNSQHLGCLLVGKLITIEYSHAMNVAG